MLRVRVSARDLPVSRSGVGKSGRPYAIVIQSVYLYALDPQGVEDEFPTKIEIVHNSADQVYAQGDYLLSDRSFVIRDGDLVVRAVLEPLVPNKVKS